MSLTTDLNQTIYSIRFAFQHSNWMRLDPATRNYILWDTQGILKLEEVDEVTKEALREERQAAIALIREQIVKTVDFVSS